VQSALIFKGFEAFAPTYRVRRNWSDRVKDQDLPLFAGYVFCRFPYTERSNIIDTPGVAKVVEFGGHSAEIADAEIAAIQTVVASKLYARPWPHLKAGDRVRIERGPLRGLEGTLLREKQGPKDVLQLVIGVELLMRSIAVDLEADMVAPAPAMPRLHGLGRAQACAIG
jgi:transcription antitermination factor NusG